VASGPGVKRRGYAEGAGTHRLADIAPTIREILSLPTDASPEAGVPFGEL
jgi:hypothetical protein